MLGNVIESPENWWYSLQTTPSLTPGVAVTPVVDSKGSYVQLASGANLAQDVYRILIWVNAGNTTATIRDILIDIGIDQAGGTSYSQVGGINNIFVPQASNAVFGGRWFEFPLFIKGGSSVGVRAQSSAVTTVLVAAWFFGRPGRVEGLRVAQYSETIGVSGNGGTPFTCGNTGAWQSWTSLGTLTRSCWFFVLAVGHNVGTTTAQMYFAELAYGDGTNYHTIIPCQPWFNPGTAEMSGNSISWGHWRVPAGGTLYVRGSASGTAQTTEAVAVCLGG